MSSPTAGDSTDMGTTALRRDLLRPPNLLSLARILMLYVALACWVREWKSAAFLIGCAAGLTDYVDGILARRFGQATRIGALLDKSADVIFITGATLVLVVDGVLSPVLLLVILLREVVLSALRTSSIQSGFVIPPSRGGKLATNLIMWGLGVLFLCGTDLLPGGARSIAHWIGLAGVHVGVAITVCVTIVYAVRYAHRYRPDNGDWGTAAHAES